MAVRVHDDANDRVTLILADRDLRALMAPPWDPAVLFAGIAAVLAADDRDALVLTPQPGLRPAPAGLSGRHRRGTREGHLDPHPDHERPPEVPSPRHAPAAAHPGPGPAGRLHRADRSSAAIQSGARGRRRPGRGADPASLTLESARRSLYMAESRWWTRAGVSPEEASAGLGLRRPGGDHEQGRAGARSSLSRHEGLAHLGERRGGDAVRQERRDSTMTVELRLSGDGLRFPQGSTVTCKLNPGTTTSPCRWSAPPSPGS